MLGIKVLPVERLHHTVEQFVMVLQIVEEIFESTSSGLVQSHCPIRRASGFD